MTDTNIPEVLKAVKEQGFVVFTQGDYNLNIVGVRHPNQLPDIFNDSLPALLRFEERNSMANSIETRLPFIDNRFVEKIVNNKEYYPLYKGKLKFKFFNYFRDIIPRKILARRNKIGFEAPDNEWLKKGFNKIIFKNISNCDYLNDKINNYYTKRVYHQVNEGNFNNIQTYIRIGIFSIWYNQIIKIFHEKKK